MYFSPKKLLFWLGIYIKTYAIYSIAYTMIQIYKQQFAEILAKHIELPMEEILALIEIPPENIPGDLAFPCFKLSKLFKKSPQQIANDVIKKMSEDLSDYMISFEMFTNFGGYINAHINKKTFINDFFFDIQHSTFNIQHSPKTKVLIEYMSANPNKPLHI